MSKAEKDYNDLMCGALSPKQNSWDIFESFIKELKEKNKSKDFENMQKSSVIKDLKNQIKELKEENQKRKR